MKIGLFGNMNNGLYSLARYLRDLGYDCHLYLISEQQHFLPAADSYDNTYLEFTSELDWLKTGHWQTSSSDIRKIVRKYDVTVGTDMVPAFFQKAGVKLDFMLPHGGDIFFKPYFSWQSYLKKPSLKRIKPFIGHYYEKWCQRQGLRNCGRIIMPYSDDFFEQHFAKLKLTHNRIFTSYPFLYLPQYKSDSYSQFRGQSEYYHQVTAIKSNCDFLIMQHSRQCIHKESPFYNGNENLFHALKMFVEHNREVTPHLVAFEYIGKDVVDSKKLVYELGLDKYVTWLPMMTRKEIMPVLELADIGVCMLTEGSYISYGAIAEYSAFRKPVIHHLQKEKFTRYYSEIYDCCNARTADEVLCWLNDFVVNPGRYKQMGQSAYEWFLEHLIECPIDKIVNIIGTPNRENVRNSALVKV